MPPIETADLHQAAVLWEQSGTDRYGATTVSDTPVEIPTRWEYKREEVRAADGSTILIDAVVVVDRSVPVGSNLWLGELADWYGTGSAGDDTEVMEVITSSAIPDIKNRNMRRVLKLRRLKDTPAITA